MKIHETTKFNKLRTKLKEKIERQALKEAIITVAKDPQSGKKLKGDFAVLRSFKYTVKGQARFKYTVKGQARRLIYKWDKNSIILFSFGPRESIYK
jgi:mRNA-degrading endonuclease RelE of RelBE toxin-antitoxin system